VHSPSFVAEMREVEQDYRELSTELTLEKWELEPVRRTTLDGLARLTSALQ
jgi:cardiolipin synthase